LSAPGGHDAALFLDEATGAVDRFARHLAAL
jgi:hypothetical protein